jgi:two-component system, OmpR family, KDP operon response regulator KdpE
MADSHRILIVEDDAGIRKLLRVTLVSQGYAVDEAANGLEGQQMLLAHRPDVIVLDLGLPDRDGQDLIRDWREWTSVPIIVLSAREQESDKVEALESGADDYLTKPFAQGELLARIKVSLRHAHKIAGDGVPVYAQDGLTVDLAARSVTLDGEEVRLTPIEYKLLSLFVRHAGKVLTHSHLLKEVWGKHSLDQSHTLRIHTQHLREKLKDDPLKPRFIMTEPGIGYRFRG